MIKQKAFCNPRNATNFMLKLSKSKTWYQARGNEKLTVVFYQV